METHSSILVWRIPWTEDPSRPQSMGSQRSGETQGTVSLFEGGLGPSRSPLPGAQSAICRHELELPFGKDMLDLLYWVCTRSPDNHLSPQKKAGKGKKKMQKVGSGQTGDTVRCFTIPTGRKRVRAGLGLPTLLPLAIALRESFHFADTTELAGLASR